MGFFKSLRSAVFGRSGGGQAKPRPRPRPRPVPSFTLVSDEAEFNIVPEEPPLPSGAESHELPDAITSALADAGEEAFLGGEVVYVQSSNVGWIQYLYVYPGGEPLNELVIGFLDNSIYAYEQVSLEEALNLYRADSKGKWVWHELRILGTVFGYKKNYRKIAGDRHWERTGDSISRHEAIPPTGEVTKGYHPLYNYKGVKGPMGAVGGGINLGKRGGSKKIAYFSPNKAKTA